MATRLAPARGRGAYIADINLANNQELFYTDKFFAACDTLNYHEIIALARAIRVTPRTVYNWKYHQFCPQRIGDLLLVIDWVAAGKPIKLQNQAELRPYGMFNH
jgi:hypothetical protein